MPLITRIFSLEDMGLISIFISFVTIPSSLAVFKFENVLLLCDDVEESKTLWSVFLWSITIVSSCSLIFFFIFHYNTILGINELPLWSSIFVVLFIFGSGISNIVRTLLVREQDFHSLSSTMVLKNVLNVLIRIIVGFFGGGFFALIAAELLCLFSFFIQLIKKGIKQIVNSINTVKFSNAVVTAKKWKKFPLYESPSILLDQLSSVLPLLLIAQMLGITFAGLFALSYRVTFLPGTHLGFTMGEVFRGQFSQLFRNGQFRKAKYLFKYNMKKIILISIAFYIPIYFFIPRIIPIVFGNKWSGASDLVKYITPWAATSFVVSTLSSVFSVMQIQYLKLVYDISAILLLFAAMNFLPVNNIANFTKAICISNIVSNSIYFILIVLAYKKLIKCAALQV